MNNFFKQQRSNIMRSIKSKDTKIEIILRKALWHKGIRYRKNYKICDCRVDIAITKHKIAIFCDGDFWHARDDKFNINTNSKYWHNKFQRNKERDLENTIALRDNGWIVLRYWESDINHNLEDCIADIIKYISER